MTCRCSNPFYGLFSLVIVLLDTEKFNFDDIQIILIFLLLVILLISHLRNHCQTEDHEGLPLCFLLRVLALIFRSLIHFGSIFLCDVK